MELNEKMTESMNDPNAHRSPGAPMNDTRLLSGQSRYSDYPVMSSTSNRTGWEISHLTEDKWSLRISFSLKHEDSGSLDRLQWCIKSFKEISFELFIAYGWALSFTAIRIMLILKKNVIWIILFLQMDFVIYSQINKSCAILFGLLFGT